MNKDAILSGINKHTDKDLIIFPCRELQEFSHQIAILIKEEVDSALALVDQGADMAKKVTGIY